jgi:hypothetical protein
VYLVFGAGRGRSGRGAERRGLGLRAKASLVLMALLAGFVVCVCFIPLRTTVQIGADEGFELAKATLCLKGHRLYTEIWNDQPPLHTFLITAILRHLSPSILGPRLLTVFFSVLLLLAYEAAKKIYSLIPSQCPCGREANEADMQRDLLGQFRVKGNVFERSVQFSTMIQKRFNDDFNVWASWTDY